MKKKYLQVRKRKYGKRYLMHRLIMEKHLGRKLEKNEVVHHINGNTIDQGIDNLQVMTLSEHSKLHNKLKIKLIKVICSNCKKEYAVPNRVYLQRKKRSKSGELFCSKSCSTTKNKPPIYIGKPEITEKIAEGIKNGMNMYQISKNYNLEYSVVRYRFNHMLNHVYKQEIL